eukprot:Hpha_TRINITY_DN16568_c4_g1::TRINITY_DN16568_c4_g1_i1::g.132848::m.132848
MGTTTAAEDYRCTITEYHGDLVSSCPAIFIPPDTNRLRILDHGLKQKAQHLVRVEGALKEVDVIDGATPDAEFGRLVLRWMSLLLTAPVLALAEPQTHGTGGMGSCLLFPWVSALVCGTYQSAGVRGLGGECLARFSPPTSPAALVVSA